MMEEPTRTRSLFLEFLKSHGEKAALGIVVLGGLLFLVLGWNGKYAEGEELEQRIDRLLESLDEGPEQPAPPLKLPMPRDPYVPPVEGGPLWAASLKTKFIWKDVPPPPVTTVNRILPRVAWSSAEPRPYAVDLSWTVTPYTKVEQAERKKALGRYTREVFPDLEKMLVERAPRGSDVFEVIGVAGPEARSFTDTTVELKQTYTYRLTPRAAARPMVATDRKILASPVTVPGIWALSFNGPNDGKGAYVEIRKIDRKHGVVTVKKYQEVGARLGWWPNGAGQEPTPEHYVTRDGNPVMVNLDTGVILESVERTKASIKVKRCRVIANPNAVLHEDEIVERPVGTFRIVLVEDGRRRSVNHPRLENRDERCSRHRQ